MVYDEQLKILIDNAFKEDIGDGDHSTLSCIPADKNGKAVLKIKQDGVLAGLEVAKKIFSYKQPDSVFTALKKDGDVVNYGEHAFEVYSKVHNILKCERIVLNCMQRMSGIATLTRKYVEKIAKYKTRILDTRKTTPNFRLLEKEAVRIGGADNHRFGLYDMIMLKDNHIDYCGGIENAVNRAYEYVKESKPGLKIEIEARTIDDVQTIIRTGKNKVFRIMLDNFTPVDIMHALKLINGLFETEASGGISLNNIEEFAKTGVDYISIGALIHQATSIDMSLKAVIL
jgi:nicotinate-nucleotide pyrophosphorylase (carboxylating)